MPTKNPRIHVVLEKPLYDRLKVLSKRDGLSISSEARELIRQAVYSSQNKVRRPYTGENIKKLIGKFDLGAADYDEILVSQAHG
jgi:hypothetical protein